ncbi:MAG: hypothetical protein GF311_28375, partial [Candidatus Lokiarchaeota archaeon]|nr:hypothetical protein [Candidatus Lokiarchaeota archaeon]
MNKKILLEKKVYLSTDKAEIMLEKGDIITILAGMTLKEAKNSRAAHVLEKSARINDSLVKRGAIFTISEAKKKKEADEEKADEKDDEGKDKEDGKKEEAIIGRIVRESISAYFEAKKKKEVDKEKADEKDDEEKTDKKDDEEEAKTEKKKKESFLNRRAVRRKREMFKGYDEEDDDYMIDERSCMKAQDDYSYDEEDILYGDEYEDEEDDIFSSDYREDPFGESSLKRRPSRRKRESFSRKSRLKEGQDITKKIGEITFTWPKGKIPLWQWYDGQIQPQEAYLAVDPEDYTADWDTAIGSGTPAAMLRSDVLGFPVPGDIAGHSIEFLSKKLAPMIADECDYWNKHEKWRRDGNGRYTHQAIYDEIQKHYENVPIIEPEDFLHDSNPADYAGLTPRQAEEKMLKEIEREDYVVYGDLEDAIEREWGDFLIDGKLVGKSMLGSDRVFGESSLKRRPSRRKRESFSRKSRLKEGQDITKKIGKITFTWPKGKAPLWHHYDGKIRPQEAYLEINPKNYTAAWDWSGSVEGGPPPHVRYGRVIQITVPSDISGDSIEQLSNDELADMITEECDYYNENGEWRIDRRGDETSEEIYDYIQTSYDFADIRRPGEFLYDSNPADYAGLTPRQAEEKMLKEIEREDYVVYGD